MIQSFAQMTSIDSTQATGRVRTLVIPFFLYTHSIAFDLDFIFGFTIQSKLLPQIFMFAQTVSHAVHGSKNIHSDSDFQ